MVLDASVLLGPHRTFLVAGAFLHYYDAFWSPWIVGEFVRKRTEWIADRAVREGCDRAELRQRLQASRGRVNVVITEMARVLRSVDYTRAPAVDLSWLADPDDHPIVQTALVARAHVLVTDDGDFPQGERRCVCQCGMAHFDAQVWPTRSGPIRAMKKGNGQYLLSHAMRSATATGSSQCGQGPPGPTRLQNTPHWSHRWVPR